MFGVVAWFWITQPLLSHPQSRQTVVVDPAQLETDVRQLSEQLLPRDQTHPQNLDRVAAYIHNRLAEIGCRVSDQPFTVSGNTYRNVICSLGPYSNKRIVVGAHYDSYHEYPAADDNASGVAGLIELARLLSGKKLPLQFNQRSAIRAGRGFLGSPQLLEGGLPSLDDHRHGFLSESQLSHCERYCREAGLSADGDGRGGGLWSCNRSER
jgi:hypothetical protein